MLLKQKGCECRVDIQPVDPRYGGAGSDVEDSRRARMDRGYRKR